MIERLIDSPMPIPRRLVVKNALYSRSRWLGSIPTPVSCTATVTCSPSVGCDPIISSIGRSWTPAMASIPFITRFPEHARRAGGASARADGGSAADINDVVRDVLPLVRAELRHRGVALAGELAAGRPT